MNYKTLKKLTQKKHRLEMGLCLIEGEKLVREHKNRIVAVFERGKDLTDKEFDDISGLDTPQNIFAVVPIPNCSIEKLSFPYLVLDGIQDPGNVGTLLRTALAFGYNTVYAINCADVWSQKVIRSAMGAQFSLNIIPTSLDKFKPHGYLFIADLNGDNLSEINTTDKNFGLVLGNEGNGISPELKQLSHKIITIPMIKNGAESLNVSVAGGIIMYNLMK